MSAASVEELLEGGAHHVYRADGLLDAPRPGVRAAAPLEPPLANPIRVTLVGAEERHHQVVAMLGAKWFRDVSPPAQLLHDLRDPRRPRPPNNQATALRITLATGEHVTKLIVGHARPGSRPGAHLIYTHFTRDEGRAAALVAAPERLLGLLSHLLEGAGYDLTGLSLVRPLHHALPGDLVSDVRLQQAFRRPRSDLLPRLQGAARRVAALQAATIAQLALLEGVKATQRKQATSVFDRRRTLEQLSTEVEAERAALARERAGTDAALADLDSRDAAIREAARLQLGREIERARDERDAARAEAAGARDELEGQRRRVESLLQQVADAARAQSRLMAELAERDAALAEAEEIVQELYRQAQQLHGPGTHE